jgi:hypothetical protein
MNYPKDWPRCPQCDDFALDGHITCGRLECDEALERDKAGGKRAPDGYTEAEIERSQRRLEHLFGFTEEDLG